MTNKMRKIELCNYICKLKETDMDLGRTTLWKPAIKVGEPKVHRSPKLEFHIPNGRIKSHILQLGS
uniref:Uncharacterized protein n=1 Tax=Rhizophora mucronata TaxID=61149 RepID=A0A2P2NUC2_RHIMU